MASGYSKKTLRELAVVIFAHWFAILAITVIITGATILACLTSKKIYRSEVTLWARQSKAANPLEDRPDPMSRLEVFLKTQQEILLSDIVLRRTMARLCDSSLVKEPADYADDSPAGNSVWQAWYEKVNKEAERFTGKDMAKFRKEVKITTPGGEDIAKSEVFTIVVEQPQPPERAQLGAELLTQEYLIHRRLLQSEFDTSARDLLERQLADLRGKILGGAENKLSEFIKQNVKGNLLDLAQLHRAGGEVNHQRIRTAFQEELISIDAEVGEYKALKTEVLAQIPTKAIEKGADALTAEDIESTKLVIPEKVMTNNTIITKLKQKLADLIIERNALREQFSDSYAPVRQKTGEILSGTRDIIKELEGELKAIDQHISTLEARRAEIQKQVDSRDKIIDNLSSLYVGYESLQREVELSRSLYDQKRKDLLEAETGRQMAQREVLITKVDKASLPDVDRPARPILWLYTLVAAIAGLLMGVAYAFLVESYDHSVASIDQAERYFGKQVLVTVPVVSGGIIRK
jgi:uncharacterized protein involved in exopolysaccharide biosynthesis